MECRASTKNKKSVLFPIYVLSFEKRKWEKGRKLVSLYRKKSCTIKKFYMSHYLFTSIITKSKVRYNMKIFLIVFILTSFNVYSQNEVINKSDSIYYSNLFKNKSLPGYYFYIPIKNYDTVYQLIINYQSLKSMMGIYGSLKKDKEFVEIVLNALLNNDTIKLTKSYINSFDSFIISEEYKLIADSIASFGQEYFLDYFFNTLEYKGIKQFGGEFKYDKFKLFSNDDLNKLQNAVIYKLFNWRLYVFHKGYSGELIFVKIRNIDSPIKD